ncbi:MAG: thiamine pyrophosphate-binding protein [Deltaproteobacteria bacterium]|nr:thiamine pyrophosphate-binding protein [Deltaproteobacteria bacterium]
MAKKITGAEAFLELLREEDVEYIFGILGGTENVLLDAIEKRSDIKYMITLNEAVAMGMAMGYSRASSGKKFAIPLVHACAGLTATFPLLLNAYLGGEPLVVITGQQDTRSLIQEPHMSGDLVGLTSHLTKWATEVIHAENIPLTLRRAFKVAKQAPTGPVYVSLPQNLMMERIDFENVSKSAVSNNIHPDKEAVATAAKLLAGAKDPLVIVEEGITKYEALPEIVELVESIGAPVYHPWMADVDFPTNHPHYMGFFDAKSKNGYFATTDGPMALRDMIKTKDVLVVVGAPLFAQPGHPEKPLVTKSTKIIQIDDNPWEIAKNYPVTAGLLGSIKISLTELNGLLKDKMTDRKREEIKERAAAVAEQKKEIMKFYMDKAEKEKDNMPMAFSRFTNELKKAFPKDAVLVFEAPSYRTDFRLTMDFAEPLGFIGGRGGASIGWGMPAALGVKLAVPNRPVLALIGDGSAMWSNQSLWVAAHYHIPVTYIIIANAGYRAGRKMGPDGLLLEGTGCNQRTDFEEPGIDFSQLAESMGVSAQKVEGPEKLEAVLTSAIDSNKPNVIEVFLEKC